MDLGPLGELVAFDHALESRLVDEVVVDALALPEAHGAGGVGNREDETALFSQKPLAQRGLARTRGRRDDHQEAGLLACLAHEDPSSSRSVSRCATVSAWIADR